MVRPVNVVRKPARSLIALEQHIVHATRMQPDHSHHRRRRRCVVVIKCVVVGEHRSGRGAIHHERRRDVVENVIHTEDVAGLIQLDTVALRHGVLRAIKVAVAYLEGIAFPYPDMCAVALNVTDSLDPAVQSIHESNAGL